MDHKRPIRNARNIILWSVASYVVLQLALTFYLEAKYQEIYDPEFRDRLMLLRQRVAESPERPLLLVVGSSRIMTGVAPEQLPPLTAAGGEYPLPFNACHTGAGALHNLLTVKRLLREGFKPKWMVVEVVPYLLPAAQQSTIAKLALKDDLPTLRPYMRPTKLYGWYAAERATAAVHHRGAILRCIAPTLPFQDGPWDCMPMEPLGGKTWTEPIPDRAEIVRRTAIVRSNYHGNLQRFHIHPTARQAMQELLELCRERKIATVLLVTPESSEFRGWYSEEAKNRTSEFCDDLSRTHDVPVVDARAWLPDDAFSDGHHIMPEGAKLFTARLGSDVLGPLVRGERGGASLSKHSAAAPGR